MQKLSIAFVLQRLEQENLTDSQSETSKASRRTPDRFTMNKVTWSQMFIK